MKNLYLRNAFIGCVIAFLLSIFVITLDNLLSYNELNRANLFQRHFIISVAILALGGAIIGFLHTISVIRRISLEKMLAENRIRFKGLVETLNEGICVFDKEFNFTYINPHLAEMFGYKTEELLGRNFSLLIHPSIIDFIKAKQDRRKQGLKDEFSAELVRKDGTTFLARVSAAPLFDESGIFIGSISAVRDVSESSLLEKTLEENEYRYRELFDNINSCVAVYKSLDADATDFLIMQFNKAAERADKVKRGDIIGKKVTDIFPGIREFGIFEVFRRVYKTGMPERFPAKLYKDGRIEGWRENYVYRLPTGEVVAVYEDLTEKIKKQ